MAGRIYLSMAYVAPRAALWLLLFVAALVDGIRHRAVRSRGCAGWLGLRTAAATAGAAAAAARFPTLWLCAVRLAPSALRCSPALCNPPCLRTPRPLPSCRRFQLFWALVVCAALFVLQDIVLLVLVGDSSGKDQAVNRGILGAYIFFADLATSYWIGILLLVAAGFWCVRACALDGNGGRRQAPRRHFLLLPVAHSFGGFLLARPPARPRDCSAPCPSSPPSCPHPPPWCPAAASAAPAWAPTSPWWSPSPSSTS